MWKDPPWQAACDFRDTNWQRQREMAVSAGLLYKVLSKYHKELEDEYVAKSWRFGVREGRPNEVVSGKWEERRASPGLQ